MHLLKVCAAALALSTVIVGCNDDKDFPPVITGPASLADGVAGTPGAPVTFTAAGRSPFTFNVSAGALPPGLALDAATGALTGTPSAPGSYDFTITATNPAGEDSNDYTLVVTEPAFNAHVLVNGNSLAALATSYPAGSQAPTAVTGLLAGDTLVSIDRRPQNGFLYGLEFNAGAGTVQLYAIAPQTGVATPIGTTGAFVGGDGVTPVAVGAGGGTTFGIDFNPAVDRVRVVNSAGQNFRLNPNSGAFVDGNMAVAGVNMDGAINGSTTEVQETAYTNSSQSATMTTQYTLDAATDSACIQNPPNAGTQTACQAFSSAVDAVLGFDITPDVSVMTSNSAAVGTGFALLRLAGQPGAVLATVNLANGMVGNLGAAPSGGGGLAIQATPAFPHVGLSADGTQIVRFTLAAGTVAATTASVATTGVTAGEVLVGLDFRPQTGQLYGLGVDAMTDTATLYLIDPQTGAATAVGVTGQIAYVDATGMPVDLPAATAGYGFDFNPTVDRVRVTTGTGLNFRVNPFTGGPVDGNLNVTATPPAGMNTDGPINGLPVGSTGVTGAAYTNNFGQSLSGGVTTQFVLDAQSDRLFIQNPPNAGTLTVPLAITLGGTTLDFTAVNGFDIPSDVRVTASGVPPTAGAGVAALTVGGAQRLFRIDLATGAATDLGVLPAALSGVAIGQVALQ